MSTGQAARAERTESPDPSRHVTNAYDGIAFESELDDDDMDFEPSTDDNEDPDFLGADGDGDDPRGMSHGFQSLPIYQ